MAAVVRFLALDERGEEILDEMEKRTGQTPEHFGEREREYSLLAAGVGPDGFDAMLDAIDPGWRGHLTRLAA